MEFSYDIFSKYKNLLSKEAGLSFHYDRSEELKKNILKRMEIVGNFKNFNDYFFYINDKNLGALEFKNLLDSLTIGETYFFRNEAQFEVFTTTVLPKLIEKKISQDKPSLKIWSAGCSTGEEPYTLAMVLHHHLPHFKNWDISILATDINRDYLKKAKEGVYKKRAIEEIPAAYLGSYFIQQEENYILSDVIKKMVNFEYHNLVSDPYFLPAMQEIDILFCRNVLIYFDSKTVKDVVQKLAESLKKEGYLFLGHSESLWKISTDFTSIQFPQTFIYQKRKAERHEEEIPPHIPLPEIHLTADFKKEEKRWPSSIQEIEILFKEGERAFEKKEYGRALEYFEKILKQSEKHLKTLMAKAAILANQQKYKEAIFLLEKVIEEDNLFKEAYYLKGVLHEKCNQIDEAIKAFQKVLYLEPHFSVCYFHLGNLYRFQNKKNLSKKAFENCMSLIKDKSENSPVELTEDMTMGMLYLATQKALELL